MAPPDTDPARRIDDLLSGAWLLAALARAAESGDPLDPELGGALGAAGMAEQVPGGWRLLPEYRRLAAQRSGKAGLSARIGRMLRWAADAAEDRPAPARAHNDGELRAEGEESGRAFAALLEALATADPAVADLVDRPGLHFLDIGTGTAAIAAAVAERAPDACALGVDTDAGVLRLAGERVAQRGLGDRVRLRCQDAAEITDTRAFDLVWLPLGVLAPEAALSALPRLRAALRPGGTLIAATVLQDNGGPATALPPAQALARWRMARAGITAWSAGQVAQRLREAGFAAVRRPALPGHPVAAVLARAPGEAQS
ncbi:hypothetical protein GCM10027570_37180 [Streptomonospora sediminis]